MQKMAYELLISDWSSDVCSSDLPHFRACFHTAGANWYPYPFHPPPQHARTACAAGGNRVDRGGRAQRRGRHSLQAARDRGGDTADRKSVVSGKSVSVRVYLGGSRSIQ